jgi:magnesium transporter
MDERIRVLSEGLRELLSEGRTAAALALLEGLHPADAAEVLESLSREERLHVFRVWDAEESSDALQEMSEDDQVEVMKGLAGGIAVSILREMSPDDAADLLQGLPEERADALLAGMDPAKAGQLRRLMAHGEDTAGGLMTPRAMRLNQDLTVGEVLEKLRETPEDIEMIYYVYFQDERGRLTGVSSLRELIVADPSMPVKEMMHTDLITVGPLEDQEKVLALVDRYDLMAVPVVDEEGRLLGIVTVDDLMDVMEEEAKEDIYSVAGALDLEEIREKNPILAGLLGRMPWLLAALAVELFLAGGILRWSSGLMRSHAGLIVFFPVVLLLGAVVAMQSSTRITVMVLAGEAGGGALRETMREALLGFLLGLPAGGAVFFAAWSMEGDLSLGLAVALAVLCASVAASLLGAVTPVALRAAGGDPARASEPLVAAMMDVLGLAIFFLVGGALL